MKILFNLIAELFYDDRFELKELAISVFVISFATAIYSGTRDFNAFTA